MKRLAVSALLCATLATGALVGCNGFANAETTNSANGSDDATATIVSSHADGILDTSDLFTDRDLQQVADLYNASDITISSGQDNTLSEEGVYVISGTAENATIAVNAEDTAKVQLVLDGLNITNESAPAIYIASADKVFVTTTEGSTNTLAVTDAFTSTTEDNVDGVVFSKDDITFGGLGTLAISSSDNGIVGKDDVKVTGGTYQISCSGHAIEGKDSVRIADGSFQLTAFTDGIHAENADDDSLGYVYIAGGMFDITAGSDGIEGDAAVQIDGGTFNIEAAEGIEGTYVQINDGTIGISASDDGINAACKSTSYSVAIEINGGDVSVSMGQGDTDALDSNGDLFINGGTVDITAQFPFDYDGQGQLNGGTVTVNGEQVSELTNQMMGGMGGMGGGMGGGPMGDGQMGHNPMDGGMMPPDGTQPQNTQ
ncbi:MAG: carbohydrate-binding domain-containing protein [Eggerthellaceae bacterium]|nr:carbohydrate-binding domain-containing protein [Eggerthellaceae bacterium]